ncbi:hypothetical protein A0257_13585 [Hymenobacter psoromatis]|nr:hypothetical protein A0257_13585 [Hymenobacter psoromatis]
MLRAFFVGFLLLLTTRSSWAQVGPVAPHGDDFLTVTTIDGYTKNISKILITPAFQEKTEIQLEDLGNSSFSIEKNLATIQRNTLKINQQLSDLTVAGWELVEAHTVTIFAPTTRYLFRKARP